MIIMFRQFSFFTNNIRSLQTILSDKFLMVADSRYQIIRVSFLFRTSLGLVISYAIDIKYDDSDEREMILRDAMGFSDHQVTMLCSKSLCIKTLKYNND